MKNSVILTNDGTYKITITSSTRNEKEFLEKPLNEIKQKIYQYYSQAVKEKLGEKASIFSISNDSGFPYEINVHITMDK